MSPAEARNVEQRCRMYALLQTQACGSDAIEHLRRLDGLVGEALVLETDRVLRIVGVRLAQEGLGALFEEIYAAALEGCEVDPGDGRRFLQAELAELP